MGIATALILLANFVFVLWPVATAFLVFAFVTSKFDKQLCYCVYLAVFSNISPIYVSALLLCFLWIATKYFIDVKKKRKPFLKVQFFLTLAIVLISTAIVGRVNVEGFFNWALFTSIMFFIYFAFIYSDEINVKKVFDYLFVAVAVSAVLGLALCPIESIKNKVYPFDGTYYRLRLFTLNVNHLAMFCIFGIAYTCYNLVNNVISKPKDLGFFKTKEFWFEVCKLALLSVVGIMTLSKAFLLLLALVFVYMFVFLIFKLKTKSLILIVPVMIAVAGLCLVFKDVFEKLVSRFVVYDVWDNLFSKIFTGRTEIWLDYLSYVFSSPWKAIFGAGSLTKDLISKGPHNVFIYLLFRLGIAGTIAFIVLICFYVKDSKKKIKPRFNNCLLFLIYFVLALEEMIFSDRFFLFLIMGILLMVVPKKNESTENVDEIQPEKHNQPQKIDNEELNLVENDEK